MIDILRKGGKLHGIQMRASKTELIALNSTQMPLAQFKGVVVKVTSFAHENIPKHI